jgi:hypothetical protein
MYYVSSKTLFFKCSCLRPLSELDLSAWPPSCRRSYLQKSYFISILLIHVLEYIFITFIYNIVSFLNILFGTNKSKNVLIIIGIVFTVFLGPDECLLAFVCPVTVFAVISEYHHSSQHHGGNLHLAANKSLN